MVSQEDPVSSEFVHIWGERDPISSHFFFPPVRTLECIIFLEPPGLFFKNSVVSFFIIKAKDFTQGGGKELSGVLRKCGDNEAH